MLARAARTARLSRVPGCEHLATRPSDKRTGRAGAGRVAPCYTPAYRRECGSQRFVPQRSRRSRKARVLRPSRTGRRTGVTRARGGVTVSCCVGGRDPVRGSDGRASSAGGVSRAFAELPASSMGRSSWTEIRRSASRAPVVQRCVAGVGAPTPSCRRRLIRRGPATASSFRSRRHASTHATGG